MTGDIRGPGGGLSGKQLLEALQALRCSGTLLLEQDGGSLLLLIGKGQLVTSYRLGGFGGLQDPVVHFRFEAHDSGDRPTLSSPFATSGVPLMRALPRFGSLQRFETHLTDLRELIGDLQRRGFTGRLSVSHESEAGLALFHRGRIGAAVFERDAYRSDASDALRAIYRLSLTHPHLPIEVAPLDGLMVQSLLGMALGRRALAPDLNSYSGLQADERGYTFYLDGQAYLTVASELTGSSQRYLIEETVPDLQLPDDPPGWEEQRYSLTLRGRDALNPMTDLSMRFEEGFGNSGKKILETLARGLDIQETASSLRLELQEIKPWLKRLEDDGLIRSDD